MINICRVCGKEFETKIHNRATCPECAKIVYDRINNTDKTKVCLVCGKVISKNLNRRRKYCNDGCKNTAHYIMNYYSAKKRAVKKAKKETKKERYERMDNLEIKARKAGMDYGTYTAMMRMNNN